jgi:membrane protease subunit (stomatin/prohibitin family)
MRANARQYLSKAAIGWRMALAIKPWSKYNDGVMGGAKARERHDEEAQMGETDTEHMSQAEGAVETAQERPASFASEHEMPCPICGADMPDLKGGKASICPNCGFKDSCCF